MQLNKVESTKQLRNIDIKIETLKKSIQRMAITEKEIQGLNPDTKYW